MKPGVIVTEPGTYTFDSKTLEQCLKSVNKFGETVYHNLCTGQTASVPWGGLDWAICIFLFGVLGLIGLILIGGLLYSIFD